MNIIEQIDNKETKLQDTDFPHICRICQSRNNLLAFEEQSSLMGIFKLLTNIEVIANPDMPQNVCNKCISKLQSIENFIAKCIETENMLLRLLPNKQIEIKTEIVEPEDDEPMDTCMIELIKNEIQECEVTTVDEWNMDSNHVQKNVCKTEPIIAAKDDWENRPSNSNIDDFNNPSYSDILNNQEENKTKVIQEEYKTKNIQDDNKTNVTVEKSNHTRKSYSTRYSVKVMQEENKTKVIQEVNKTNDTVEKGNHTRKGYCIYCDAEVHHFVKHLERIHIDEPEIELLFSEPPGTIKRKQMILSLRKRGKSKSDLKRDNPNSSETLNIKEENKPKVKTKNHTAHGFCFFCQKEVHLFTRHLIMLHHKEPEILALIRERPGTRRFQMISSLRKRANCAASALGAGRNYRNLLTHVFPSMRPDQKTRIAQNDELICAFGATYLKSLGNDNHSVISTRMRLLAAFLIQVQRTEPSISDMLTVLQPQYWELITKVICILAKYDSILGRYNLPSVMVNCTKYIKDCCKLALEQKKTPVGVDLTTYHNNVKELWSYFDDNHKTKQHLPEVKKVPSISDENKDFNTTFNENQTDVDFSIEQRNKRRRISWSLQQQNIVLNYFQGHIQQKQSPKRHECELLKEKYAPLFENKSWEKIKAYVFNEYRVN
uniref:Uncharacterized protein LOC114325818 isoform X1 n=2 Tax=Diabrotica virgifera virgifera TaxID=50390 RepID=A0A6P7F292_DIAVI